MDHSREAFSLSNAFFAVIRGEVAAMTRFRNRQNAFSFDTNGDLQKKVGVFWIVENYFYLCTRKIDGSFW